MGKYIKKASCNHGLVFYVKYLKIRKNRCETMKKLFSLILCMLMVITSITSCKSNKQYNTSNSQISNSIASSNQSDNSNNNNNSFVSNNSSNILSSSNNSSNIQSSNNNSSSNILSSSNTISQTPLVTSSTSSTSSTIEKTGYISNGDTTIEPVRSLNEIAAKLSLSDLECNSYDLDKYLLPYWKGNIVYNESLNFIKDKNTGIASAPLLYDPLKVLSVKDSSLGINYVEGQDYIIKNGEIVLTTNSRIHCFNYSDMFFSAEKGGSSWALKKGGYTYFAEGPYFHTKQVAVTYLHNKPWTGYKPAYQGENLPNIINKLKSGKDVKIVFCGDSITKGGNASGMFGANPKTPIWADMLIAKLKKTYPNAKITSFNPAVNGSNSIEGLRNSKVSVSDQKPDLVIIGYGMNDGADANITPAAFKNNIKSIMDVVNEMHDKSCEFILLSTTLPNQDIKLGNANMQGEYSKVLFELERKGILNGTGGAVVADMTAIHQEILKTKRFFDMTANNVNHPNDFLVRAYGQMMCTLLIEN